MAVITTSQKALLFFMSLFWGLGHFYLGYRLKGISIFYGCIAIFAAVKLLVDAYSPQIDYILLLLLVALILCAPVIYDMARTIKRINKQSSNKYENISSMFPVDISNKVVECKRCYKYNYDDYEYCFNCGIKLKNMA